MVNISKNDVLITFIQFVNGTDGKKRPVLVVVEDEQAVGVYAITTKYSDKSKFIKKQYYPIKDWRQAGLKVKSYVDIGSKYTFKKRELSYYKIGHLSIRDIRDLEEFIVQFTKNQN